MYKKASQRRSFQNAISSASNFTIMRIPQATTTILIILIHWGGNNTSNQCNALRYAMYQLFSICGDNHEATAFTNTSFYISRDMNSMKNLQIFLRSNKKIEWRTFDVCNSTEKLTEFVTDIILNSSYTYDNEVPANDSRLVIVTVGTHLTPFLFKTLQELISSTDILLFDYRDAHKYQRNQQQQQQQQQYKQQQYQHQIFFHHKQILQFNSFMSSFYEQTKANNWKDITLLYMNGSKDYFDFIYKETLRVLLRPELHPQCVKTSTINLQMGPETILKTLTATAESQQHHQQLVVMIGDKTRIETFLEKTSEQINATLLHKIVFLFFEFMIQPRNRNIRVFTISDFKRFYFQNNHMMGSIGRIDHSLSYSQELSAISTHILILWSQLYGPFHRANINAQFGILNLGLSSPKVNIPGFYPSPCGRPLCPPGFYQTFGNINKTLSDWDVEVGYKCKPCLEHHVKTRYGDQKCVKCPGLFIPNKKRTKCISPFQTAEDLNIFTPLGAFCISLNIVGGMMALIFIVVFVKARNTPIVKISDMTTSLVHLSSNLLLFVASYALYFNGLDTTKCVARSLVIGILYNLNISIILVKSHKLVMAFKARIRVHRDEVLKLKLKQFFIVFINLIITACLYVIVSFRNLPEIRIESDFVTYQEHRFCADGNQNNIQIGFSICLQMVCIYEAYHCRRLPSYLSEVMSILYLSFLTTISILASFPMYYFQSDISARETVHLVALMLNSLAVLVFMYALKAYTIVFKPHLNTKDYFQSKRVKSAFRDAQNKLSVSGAARPTGITNSGFTSS